MQRASRIIQAVLAEDEGGEHEQLEVAPEGQQRQVAADEASESEITLAAGEATTARSAAGVALSGIELPGERTPVPPPRPQQGEAGDTAQMHQMQAPAAPQMPTAPQPTAAPMPKPAANPMGAAPMPAAPQQLASAPPAGANPMGAAQKPPQAPNPQMPAGGQPQPQAAPMGTFKRGGHVTTKVTAAVRSKKAPRW